jgi:hypothetical protein
VTATSGTAGSATPAPREHLSHELSGGAEIALRRQPCRDLRGAEVSGDHRILRQHLRQRPARGQGTLAGFFDRAVGGLLAHRHGQSHGDRFRHDEAAGQLEVRAHARRIDHEAVEGIGHRARRARGEEDQLRQRLPFRGPAPETALVLLGHGREERGDQAGRADRRRQRGRRPDRVALVRHGRRSAAPRGGRFVRLADLGLGQERDVARDLAQRSNRDAQRSREVSEPIAVRVPR